jgi:hypothetical protein
MVIPTAAKRWIGTLTGWVAGLDVGLGDASGEGRSGRLLGETVDDGVTRIVGSFVDENDVGESVGDRVGCTVGTDVDRLVGISVVAGVGVGTVGEGGATDPLSSVNPLS